ncbi:MAG: hypothetical protein QME81_01760 [bacterium]|nr:hypothetical protein [bacterium]
MKSIVLPRNICVVRENVTIADCGLKILNLKCRSLKIIKVEAKPAPTLADG